MKLDQTEVRPVHPPCFNYHILVKIKLLEGGLYIYLEFILNIYKRRWGVFFYADKVKKSPQSAWQACFNPAAEQDWLHIVYSYCYMK